MKKTMKKLISLALAATMMLGVCSIFTGCFAFAEGTEAAKLLLANERMDENFAFSGVDIGIPGYEPTVYNEKSGASLAGYRVGERSSGARTINRDVDEDRGIESLRQFDSFIINIENEAKNVAEAISYMKNSVGVVDKWVAHFEGKYMLRVYDSYEMLLNNEPDGDQNVYLRYTDENANNVYEMYSFLVYDDGHTGNIKTVYVVGERYEYYFEHSDGFSDCVIIENSRGYWMLTRFNYLLDESDRFCNFTTIRIKDDFICETSASVYPDIDNPGDVNPAVTVSGHMITDAISEKTQLSFSASDGRSTDEMLADAEEVLDANKNLKRSKEEIMSAAYHSAIFGEQYSEQVTWYGIEMKDMNSLVEAVGLLRQEYSDAKKQVGSVLDYPTAVIGQTLGFGAKFASLAISGMGSNSYADGVITLSGISASVAASSLIEAGEDYVLKVALSLVDENGNPIATNTVALADEDAVASRSASGGLNLSASGDFAVPKNLHQGDYALVVYAATAEDGIRISEMVKVASFSTYNERLDSSAMDISVATVSGNLHLTYVIKNSLSLTLKAENSSYTVEEIEHLIMLEILRCGAPFRGAALEYADGTPAADGLGKGSYRMLCYLPTSDGMAQSYVYLTIE